MQGEAGSYGFYRLAAATPSLRVADVDYNVQEILRLGREAAAAEAAVVCFPELCLTGYTCADLFLQTRLLTAARAGLLHLADASRDLGTALVVGAPLVHGNRLYNCACLLAGGRVLGIVPKSFVPNYQEFYEKRWFASGRLLRGGHTALGDDSVPLGVDLLFEFGPDFRLGLEVCEDLWHVLPPSSLLALGGATVLANLSASDELVGKADYRRHLVQTQSARCVAAYLYSSCGVHESTTDLVFGGHALIAENGALLAENTRFLRQGSLLTADVDCQRLVLTRLRETSFPDSEPPTLRSIPVPAPRPLRVLHRHIDQHPFVPGDPAQRDARCQEIFSIQAAGLAKRLEHTHCRHPVIGISGGLDSTLALLVTVAAVKLVGGQPADIVALTMPGFGTSDRTRGNALQLCRELGVSIREIDIGPACRQHFADVGHDPDKHDRTFENIQARERTQMLMDVANMVGGLVVGTGDLSEIALGWSTYNGDHMSMYAVNCSVPKTLIKDLVAWAADHAAAEAKATLHDILDTPISPELLPRRDDDEIHHRTEDLIGPYELHDFFLYHMLKYGAPPDKLAFLARHAFAGRYDEPTIEKWLTLFLRRFFSSQFKRSCIPDGPKVGTISLSPRGDWRMPSDASANLWLDHGR